MLRKISASEFRKEGHSCNSSKILPPSVVVPYRLGAGLLIATLLALGTAVAAPQAASNGSQTSFKTPQLASASLLAAYSVNNTAELAAIFGPNSENLVSSGDPAKDRTSRALFASLAQERVEVEKVDDNTAILLYGEKQWPFPIPLVKQQTGWVFDTAEGQEEIINRRIGKNELETIETLAGVVSAQHSYFKLQPQGKAEFASKFISTHGKRDGLFWVRAPGEPASPLGPVVATMIAAGYQSQAEIKTALHGYHYKLLTKQGASAPGGKLNYLGTDGKLTKGFAILAYPVEWGSSGVMSFMVGKDGYIYQQDLGEQTEKIAGGMSEFNPTREWEVLDPSLTTKHLTDRGSD